MVNERTLCMYKQCEILIPLQKPEHPDLNDTGFFLSGTGLFHRSRLGDNMSRNLLYLQMEKLSVGPNFS